LNREILVSERRRMLTLARMLAVILALILLMVTFDPGFVRSIYHGRLPVRPALTAFSAFIAYELFAAAVLTILPRRDRNFPVFGRYAPFGRGYEGLTSHCPAQCRGRPG
jgi:hypothetical protein